MEVKLWRAALVVGAALSCSSAFAQTQSFTFSGVVFSNYGNLQGIPLNSPINGTFTINLNAANPLLSGTVVPATTTLNGGNAAAAPLMLNWSATVTAFNASVQIGTANVGPQPFTYVQSSIVYQQGGALQMWEDQDPQSGSVGVEFYLAPQAGKSTYFLNGMVNFGGVALGPSGSWANIDGGGTVYWITGQFLPLSPEGGVNFYLTSLRPIPASLPQVLNINAATSGYNPATATVTAAPVALTLGAGCYTVEDAFGRFKGALYDAFNFHLGVADDWAWQYRVVDVATSATILYVSAPTNASPAFHYGTESLASAAGLALPISKFCLPAVTTIAFVIDDNYSPDNTGGISLILN